MQISIGEASSSILSKELPEIIIRYDLVHHAIDPDIIKPANIMLKKEYWRARRQ